MDIMLLEAISCLLIKQDLKRVYWSLHVGVPFPSIWLGSLVQEIWGEAACPYTRT